MIDLVDRVERASASIWSAEERAAIDGWELSAAHGFTRRLNSATTTGAGTVTTMTGHRIAAWLASRGIPMTIRVTPLVADDTVARAADMWRLHRVDPTWVMTKLVASGASEPDIRLVDPRDRGFTDEMFRFNGRDPRFLPQWFGILERLEGRGAGLWMPNLAVGFVGVFEGVCCVYSIAVNPAHRRRGMAKRIMAAAEAWGGSKGADLMALQVLGTNSPAVELYDALGYDRSYGYSYLEPPVVASTTS